MSRSRRVSVDGNGTNPGSNWDLPIYLNLALGDAFASYQVYQLQGYGIDIGAADRVTTVTIWADGLVSFGPPTDAQIAFMTDDYPNGADVFGFPGDFISLGHVGPDLPAAFTQDSSYGLFIDFGTIDDQSKGFFRDVRGELLITSDGRVELDGGEDGYNSRIAFRVNGLTWDPTVITDQPQPDITLAYQIIGDDGRQTLIGTDASETIIGKGDSDRLTGGGGVDSFKYLAVSDSPVRNADRIYDFASGVDRIDATGIGATGYSITQHGILYFVELYTLNGTLQITSDKLVAATDIRIGNGITLAGTAGGDVLTGLDGNDTIIGGTGADLLTGNAGQDTFRFSGFGDSTSNRRDVITDFTSGVDRFDFGALTITGYSILADDTATIVTLNNGNQRLSVRVEGTIAFTDLVTSITQTLRGTNAADALQALTNGSILQGRDGDDTLTGYSGDDQLFGGSGADGIDGGDGKDLIVGGAGADVLTGGRYDGDTFRIDAATDSILSIRVPDPSTATAYVGPSYDVSGADRITDFGYGDQLDVSALKITRVEFGGFVLRLDTADGMVGVVLDQTYDLSAVHYGKSIATTGSAVAEHFFGLDGDDRLAGAGGNDELSGYAGKDILYGGDGDDLLNGGAGDDVSFGGAGDDRLVGGGNGDREVMHGNAGADSFTMYNGGAAAGGSLIDGGDGDDTVSESFLSVAQFSAYGGAGDDVLAGTLARTLLWGGSGNDTLTAGRGLQAVVDFDPFTGQPVVIYDSTFGAGSEMHGGDGNDTIAGAEGDDVAYGGAGNDTISGGDGFDALSTANGDAFNFPAKDGGADQLFGEAGDDSIDGGTGADTIDGGDGDDYLSGGSSAALGYLHDGAVDIVRGGAGNDFIAGVGQGDIVNGGTGEDSVELDFTDLASTVSYTLANGLVTTRAGTFSLVSIEGANFYGGSEDDFITGGAGTDRFATGVYSGYGGADVLNGAGGDDIFYQNPNDYAVRSIDGGEGNDQLVMSFSYGAAAINFSLLGGSSISFEGGGRLDYVGIERLYVAGTNNGDTLTGGNLDDELYGEGGNDTLNGGAGDDFLNGGFGTNTLNGGDGVDTAVLSFFDRSGIVFTLTSGVTVTDSYGTHTLNSIEALSASGSNGGDQITGGDGANTIQGQNGNDTLTGGGAVDMLFGGNDSDTLNGLAGDDRLFGGGGGDTLNGGDGNDILTGEDPIYGYDGYNDALSGGAGDDRLIGYGGNDSYDGGAGVDTITLDLSNVAGGVTFDLRNTGSIATIYGTKTITSIEAVELTAGAGNDKISGGIGGDILRGSDGLDSLYGNEGADLLIGGEGADTLDGGAGFDAVDYSDAVDPVRVDLLAGRAVSAGTADVLVSIEHARGTTGGDTLIAGAAARVPGDIVKPQDGPTTIRLDGAFSRTADASIDQATTLPHATVLATASGQYERYAFSVADAGAAAIFDIDATSDGLDTVIILYDESGAVLATSDDDSDDAGSTGIRDSYLNYDFARAGDYVLVVQAYGGGPIAAGANYTLNVSIENEIDYWLEGGEGDDTLVSGTGSDRLDGGDGIDTVAFNGTAAVVVDLLRSSARGQGDDVLSGIENVLGSRRNDALRGDGGANLLDGRGGADEMSGRGGDDRYVVDDARDRVIEAAGGGYDTVRTSVSYALAAGQEIEALATTDDLGTGAIMLTGNEFANMLRGNAGANVLDGGGGADVMSGGAGNDVYYVDDTRDRTFESGNGGDDRVYAVRSYTLTAGQSIERLYAADPAATTALILTGNEIANEIVGNAGANTLDGGAGDDRLSGGLGSDVYLVNSSGDRVFEDVGGGTDDRVLTKVDYTLGAGQEIERLIADDPAAVTPLSLTGNEFVNYVYGNAGANRIDGGAGADRLVGGAGDDRYTVDNSGDRVIEAAGGGSDRVTASATFTLGAGQEVEFLIGAGNAAIDLTGNEFGNVIQGNARANRIAGGLGGDRLTGGGGADTFVFDTALGHGNVDRIDDFAVSTVTVHDRIELDHAVFSRLGIGALSADAFKLIGGAIDADDRILYDASSGALFYDPDGSDARGAVQFATLIGAPALTAADIVVV